MPTNDASNVAVGKPLPEGAAFVAQPGTELPTSALTKLPSEWINVGYASDAGLTNTLSRESTEIKAWGGATVATVQTGYSETYKLKLIECLNEVVLKELFGQNNVTVSGGEIRVAHTAEELTYHPWCFDVILSDRLKRVLIPEGKITSVGDTVYVDGDVVGYEITISCRPTDDGATSIEFIAELPRG